MWKIFFSSVHFITLTFLLCFIFFPFSVFHIFSFYIFLPLSFSSLFFFFLNPRIKEVNRAGESQGCAGGDDLSSRVQECCPWQEPHGDWIKKKPLCYQSINGTHSVWEMKMTRMRLYILMNTLYHNDICSRPVWAVKKLWFQ